MKRLYIDSDILLDLFMKRDAFYEPASELLSLIDMKQVKAFTTPLVFSNLFYILRKHRSKSIALKTLTTLREIIDIAPVSKKSTDLALNSEFTDFEDALQYYSAIEAGAGYIITRNKSDYKHSEIPVLSAKEFLTLYHSS